MMSSLKADENSLKPKFFSSRPIRLPNESWTDSFKMLSRRELVLNVQPVCARFHAICEQNVPSVHMITNYGQFLDGLAHNLPTANRQYADLAASDANLAKHFRFDEKVCFKLAPANLDNQASNKRYLRAQMCVLKHSMELFVGCRLFINFEKCQPQALKEVFAYLNILQIVHPSEITLNSGGSNVPLKFWHIDEMLHSPTILDCYRLTTSGATDHKMKLGAEAISNWLHYLPTNSNSDHSVQQQQSSDILTRVMKLDRILPSTFEELVAMCKKNFFQAQSASDRRSFVVHATMTTDTIAAVADQQQHQDKPWRVQNDQTGEVLLCERVINNRVDSYDYQFCIRRCHANVLKEAENWKCFHLFVLLRDYDAPGTKKRVPTLAFG